MNPSIDISPNQKILVQRLTEYLKKLANRSQKDNKNKYVALSGGSTPRLWFDHLASKNALIDWTRIHLFWGDERCVPPGHAESNFGMTKKYLLDKIKIPEQNIHRIRGEDNPAQEAVRYGDEIIRIIGSAGQNWPVFDWILLGLGIDGHTASLFPGSLSLEISDKICITTEHPQTGQKRITLTLPVLNHARRVSFLISGKSKAAIVAQIINGEANSGHLPAAQIQPVQGDLEWFLDVQAAGMIL